jgi:hypothetical protein
MKKLVAVVFAACCGLTLASPAAAVDFGITEDDGKSNPELVFAELSDLGMTRNVVRITWDAARPTALPPEAEQLDRLVAQAETHGVEIVFAVYLKRSVAAPTTRLRVAQLATWTAEVARRWPTVRTFIGPNEPNQPRFWRPQFTRACANASGPTVAAALGAMYDALKSVDAGIQVLGSLSPRGNDRCKAKSNVSTSPVRFLAALGRAYRSGRGRTACRPLMDGLSFHPYPPRNQDSPAKGYVWPNIGMPNLARLKQAFWDAFGGTCQDTFEDGLALHLNELGYQTRSPYKGYVGRENVTPISERTQGRYYAAAIARAACDPAVASLNLFHLVDEAPRDRFQSGLLRLDRTKKASYATVRAAIAAAKDGCAGTHVYWRPATSVIGARAMFGPLGRSRRSFRITALEGATYTAGVFRAASAGQAARALAGNASARPVLRAKGTIKALRRPAVRFRGKLEPGRYVYAVRLRAETNTSRTATFVSRAFTIR